MSDLDSGSSRTEHEIHMLAGRARIAVQRDDAGRITSIEAVQADAKRRALIDAASRGIAAGRTVDDALMNSLAFSDLWRALAGIERGVP